MRAFTRIWARLLRLLVVRCRGRHHRRCERGADWQGVRWLRGAPAPSDWRERTNSSRVREAYPDEIYRRLAEVKATYDPDNAFHHNQNIQPG